MNDSGQGKSRNLIRNSPLEQIALHSADGHKNLHRSVANLVAKCNLTGCAIAVTLYRSCTDSIAFKSNISSCFRTSPAISRGCSLESRDLFWSREDPVDGASGVSPCTNVGSFFLPVSVFNSCCGYASTQSLKPLSNDTSDLWTDEHVPALQRFFHLVNGSPNRGFACSKTDLARQVWNLVEAHCAQHENARRTASSLWDNLVYPSVQCDDDDPLRGPTGPWAFCPSFCFDQLVLTLLFGGVIPS